MFSFVLPVLYCVFINPLQLLLSFGMCAKLHLVSPLDGIVSGRRFVQCAVRLTHLTGRDGNQVIETGRAKVSKEKNVFEGVICTCGPHRSLVVYHAVGVAARLASQCLNRRWCHLYTSPSSFSGGWVTIPFAQHNLHKFSKFYGGNREPEG